MAASSSQPLHSVVSIFSPVKMALAPAMKHSACFSSDMVLRPAAMRMMVDGMMMRAVAMVRSMLVNSTIALRVAWERRDGMEQTNTVLAALTKTQNSTRADINSSITDMTQCLQSLVVAARRDDVGVKLSASINIVVVRRESCRLELLGLLRVDHAQRYADLHSHALDALDHGLDVLEAVLASAHVPPRGAHAEASASLFFSDSRRCEDALNTLDSFGGDSGAFLVSGGLSAVGAVFGATACFDVHQGAELHFGGVVPSTMDGALVEC
ncbi:hypothetical protein HG531_002582 [Fusarium graminearum]|nr:hypothetical protein HG531_002582 [Fusarium graminearum]